MTEGEEAKTKRSIRFRDLTLSLKILVIFGWIYTVLLTFAFLIGFVLGIIETLVVI